MFNSGRNIQHAVRQNVSERFSLFPLTTGGRGVCCTGDLSPRRSVLPGSHDGGKHKDVRFALAALLLEVVFLLAVCFDPVHHLDKLWFRLENAAIAAGRGVAGLS